MCGIAGAVGRIDDTVRAAVVTASERQRHRGPDADGFFASVESGEGVALAHRRLAIIDLSEGGAQPKVDPMTGTVITFNGEIYNFRELRSELRALGVEFRTESDTEVLLNAYRHWGDAFLSRLVGMFAFAIWDPRRRRLLLARDRLGIKPLYWTSIAHAGGRTLLFASELRALLATGLVPRVLDPASLETYLWHGFVAGPRALARGVRRLSPGEFLEVDFPSGEVRERRYWSLPQYAPRTHADGELHAVLREAVRLRLIADVPLGIFLSGGIDSSVVTALAASCSRGPIHTFNVSFEEAEFDESSFAARVARGVGAHHSDVRLSGQAFSAGLGAALESLDQPSFDAINTFFVSRAVREAGMTVALAGTGGDELFGGYRSFVDLPRLARISRVAGALGASAWAERVAASAIRGSRGSVPRQTRWGKLADAFRARGDLTNVYQLATALFTPSMLGRLAPGLDWASTEWGLLRDQAEAIRTSLLGQPDLHAISLLELRSFIGERLLPDTDATSMAVALEARVPLLDHRVVELTAAIPLERRFRPLGRKALLREAGLTGLPPELFDRPKRGFELPLAAWLRDASDSQSDRSLRSTVELTFSDHLLIQRTGLDPAGVSALWEAFDRKDPGIYWSRPWALFVLLDWCRRERMSL